MVVKQCLVFLILPQKEEGTKNIELNNYPVPCGQQQGFGRNYISCKDELLNVTKWNKIQILMNFPKIKYKDAQY